MIEPELARRFIEQVTQYTEYNINIMNESGVIIASRDPKRVGTYHEVADRIIHGTQDMVVIRDERMFPGVLPGINMAIMHDGHKEGVVGVTGDPDKIHDVALITRMAMEAMLKYEKQQEQIRLRRSRKEHFINLLTQVDLPARRRSAALPGSWSTMRRGCACRSCAECGPPAMRKKEQAGNCNQRTKQGQRCRIRKMRWKRCAAEEATGCRTSAMSWMKRTCWCSRRSEWTDGATWWITGKR